MVSEAAEDTINLKKKEYQELIVQVSLELQEI